MTIATTLTRKRFDGNGSTTAFEAPFKIQAATDLVCYKVEDDGTVTVWQLGVDYTVTGVGNATGCTVNTLGTPLTATDDLVVVRVSPETQSHSFVNSGSFDPHSHETAFDRACMRYQEMLTVVGTSHTDARVLRLQDWDTDGEGAFQAKENKIEGVANPVNALDAVNLTTLENYVTSVAFGGATVLPMDWDLVGDGVTTSFSISGADVSTPAAYRVTIDGIVQEPTDDYTIDLDDAEIDFAAAPPDGSKIDIITWAYNKGLVATGRYTSTPETRPTPSGSFAGIFIRVKNAGEAEQLEHCMETSGGSWEWTHVATASS